ncbi:hypothetical protein ONS95_012344 [Cadophora gregata]|uniref:uncharacterized protein n=1 Tax=Cadophora gregata TaxID=51156 RepID=UPI0026DAE6F9|nr:uncharacterized protein ONS95_012344 [Cadophora gregata]KAK0118034.1 hypothetical protein ONS95_012344 [Cadophora gregata]KAK0123101.1 hypothetical protein ONS96_010107 [Cadophora gregata f. sp. sojae]
MLLQKTGWHIKHFISPKKKSRQEKSGYHLDGVRLPKTKLPTSTPKRLSWLSQTSLSDSPPLRRASSNATTRSHRLTQSNSTGHSSATSLCSCDCEANPAPIEHALFGVEPPPPLPEILYLPPTSSEDASPDSKAWRLIFQEPFSRPLTPAELCLGKTIALTPYFATGFVFDDIVGAISPGLIDDDKTPTQSLRFTGESDMDDLSENVEQLIRETDEAFKAVGSALADAKAASQGWPAPTRPAPLRPESITRGVLKEKQVSPLRSASVSKSKKKRPIKKKSNIFGRKTSKAPPPPANTPARWTLTDVTTNMADVFSGKLFRTEVDEMLTPDRIQQILKDKAETARKISMESCRSFDTGGSTPTEPFHLEGLSSRITAAQEDPPPCPSPVLPPSVTPQASPRASMKTPPPRPARPDEFPNHSRSGMVFDNVSFPPPPVPPRAGRRSSASRTASLLPTIPETSPPDNSLTQLISSGSTTNSSRPSLVIQLPPKYTFLPSTNFTSASPFFCHGPIRLDRLLCDNKGSSPEEEALDWIAFQMAIAGTIELDQYFGDQRDDAQWESDEAEIDDLINWWNSFGLGGYGRMEGEEDVREKDGPASLPNPVTVSAVNKEHREQKVPEKEVLDRGHSSYHQARTWRTWTDTPPPPIPRPRISSARPRPINWKSHTELIDTSKIPLNTSLTQPRPPQISRLTIPPEPPRRPSLAESLLSLPPSPMQNLVVSNTPGKDDDMPIPMGFNLGHDLGDFLSWEARHVQNLYSEK